MSSKTGIYELLGDPPWDEDLLRKCYFRNFTETREFIQDYYDQAIKNLPNKAVLYHGRALARYYAGQYQGAISDLVMCRRLGGDAQPEAISMILSKADGREAFLAPAPAPPVPVKADPAKVTAKQVTTWTWKTYDAAGARHWQKEAK